MDEDGASSSQQSDGDSTGASGTSDGSDTGNTTGGSQLACPEYSACSFALECESDEDCGTVLSRSDANGCPRPLCESEDDCPDGHSCVLPWGWGICGHDWCGDNPDDGTCECPFVGLDCPPIGTCVSDDVVPPPAPTGHDSCALYTDEASCNAAPAVSAWRTDDWRCRWYEGYEMDIGQACSEQVPIARCIYSAESPDVPGCDTDETLHPVALVDADQPDHVTVLLIDDEVVPLYVESSHPWLPCEDLVSGACDCACP